MNTIKELMKERIKPLLELTYKTNLLIQVAQKAGYTIRVGIGVLLKFSKDFSKGSSEIVAPESLISTLKEIEDELKKLDNENFIVDINCKRPNDNISIFVEDMSVKITSREYVQKYYT